ncbi:MAG: hypothetical protein Aurels2KO_23140 [Aureliella sp.]
MFRRQSEFRWLLYHVSSDPVAFTAIEPIETGASKVSEHGRLVQSSYVVVAATTLCSQKNTATAGLAAFEQPSDHVSLAIWLMQAKI